MDEQDEKPESHEEESWTGVEGAANPSEAALIVGFLQNHDIPARVVDRSFHQTPTSDEDLTPIEVAVPANRVEEATRVLAERNRDFEASPEGSETVLTDEGLRLLNPSDENDGGEG